MPPSSLGILPGSFNPPTCAHIELARAAQEQTDRVLLILPRRFPHKEYDSVGLGDRVRLLRHAAPPEMDIGISEGGLFLDIARECHAHYGDATDLWFVCGRDAAERIVNWPYDPPEIRDRMFEEFGLLVAERQGHYTPPAELRHRIRALRLSGPFDDVSSTEVRDRVRRGAEWQHLVPPATCELVQRLYS